MPRQCYEPRRLTKDEITIVRRHPLIGEEIFKGLGNTYFAEAAGDHHERWDGNGYPHRKKAKEIPFVATVISVADAYDAMITRPWRGPKTPEMALDEIVGNAGTQFNPDIAKRDVVESLLYA